MRKDSCSARRFRDAISIEIYLASLSYPLGVSIGVAWLDSNYSGTQQAHRPPPAVMDGMTGVVVGKAGARTLLRD